MENELLRTVVENAPSVGILLIIAWRMDMRLDQCFKSLSSMLERLVSAVVDDAGGDDEATNT